MDDPLWQALQAAHNQAMEGKGKERHGGDMPFTEQPIMAIQRMLEGSPIDGHLFQVMKKAQEAGRMAKRGDGEAAIRELYGVIVYAAAAVMRLEEREEREVRYMHRASGIEFTAPRSATAVEIEKRAREARAAINRALEEIGLQEHEIDHNIVRDTMRKQSERDKAYRARQEAIDRAGEKLRAGEFKPEDDNG